MVICTLLFPLTLGAIYLLLNYFFKRNFKRNQFIYNFIIIYENNIKELKKEDIQNIKKR